LKIKLYVLEISQPDISEYIVTNVCLQEYLCKPIPALYKQCITKIRLSSHRLAIEQGRQQYTDKNNILMKHLIQHQIPAWQYRAVFD
jgi:hypothetical protein